jgi:hypothetical protein
MSVLVSEIRKNRRRIILYAFLVALVIAGAVSWLAYPELGIHLFSAAIEVLVASTVVDRLIEWDRDSRLEPARRAAIADARELANVGNGLVLSLARSSVTRHHLSSIQATCDHGPTLWLGDIASSVTEHSLAPLYSPSSTGSGFLSWSVALPLKVAETRELINRYMVRHVPHASAELTEAVHSVEENGLFRCVESGRFWLAKDSDRAFFYRDFISKLRQLSDTLAIIDKSDQRFRGFFPWSVLLDEVASPAAPEREPWRQTKDHG